MGASMTAPALSPTEFGAIAGAWAPDTVWSREGYVVVEVPEGGGLLIAPWAPYASRGRRYRGVHRANRFSRRVADL